jgi:tetratricopeptide (TPR) repeat protein
MESYEKALKYLNEGLKITEKFNLENTKTQIIRSLNFVMNYWGEKPDYLNHNSNEIPDLHEVAFFYIRNSNYKMAIDILDSMNLDSMNELQKGFHYFYRGLIGNSKEYFYKSVTHFKMSGDCFYRKLPLIELRKLGEHEMILNALSV